MKSADFTFVSGDGTKIFTYVWSPDEQPVKAVVQIAHGMVETAARYERFAQYLTARGYKVYANDHRGHGRTAGSVEKVGYLAESDGFGWLVKDQHQLTGIIKKENPGLPVFLFGHSMGSFVSQRYIQLFGKELDGVILSGSNGPSFLFTAGRFMAKQELKKNGPMARSPKMDKLSFGSYNNAFKPNRTSFDWLSRDNAEVDKYIADPYCGVICTCEFYFDFMDGLVTTFKKENTALVPHELPVFMVSGSMDPVGGEKGVKKLCAMYKGLGVKDATMKLYEGARHEILNETNRDEVMKDVADWLDLHCQKEGK